jgi:hypothetical protein
MRSAGKREDHTAAAQEEITPVVHNFSGILVTPKKEQDKIFLKNILWNQKVAYICATKRFHLIP